MRHRFIKLRLVAWPMYFLPSIVVLPTRGCQALQHAFSTTTTIVPSPCWWSKSRRRRRTPAFQRDDIHHSRTATTTTTTRLEATRGFSSPEEEPTALAYKAFAVLAQKGRSWQRLGHLVELAMGDYDGGPNIRTVADVGTDHGLLAMGLALSNRFDKVVGVDVSQQALQDGALSLLDTVNDQRLLAKKGEIRSPAHDGSLMKEIPVEFRQSDGLKNIQAGEADAVCIAGMGVNTMLQILLDDEPSTSSNDEEGILNHLDRIDCQQLILQPTNSRPRNLILLYDRLQESGWCLVDERIEELASRWYITACFLRSKPNDNTRGNIIMDLELPTSRLVVSLDSSNSTRRAYEDYVEHHVQWIQRDTAARGTINDADKRWLAQHDR